MSAGNSTIIDRLHKSRTGCFNRDGLKVLCLSLGVPPENVIMPRKTIDDAAFRLIEYCRQRGIEDALSKAIIDSRASCEEVKRLKEAVQYSEKNTLDLLPPVSAEERRELTMKIAAPSGIVIILFSDIEGFSSFSQTRNEETVYELLKQHNNIVRERIAKYRGYEVKTLGDGF